MPSADAAATAAASGGGIGMRPSAVTDDGVRCAVEHNCVRWGRHELPPRAGIGVYERGPDGPLAAVRVYDDIEARREGEEPRPWTRATTTT